ncbi:MAG: hypothetical protein M1831_001994 [Alyxoria varia]|nr:MAG: hypothetical protein M1831_001994 [Alyxoria varia]
MPNDGPYSPLESRTRAANGALNSYIRSFLTAQPTITRGGGVDLNDPGARLPLRTTALAEPYANQEVAESFLRGEEQSTYVYVEVAPDPTGTEDFDYSSFATAAVPVMTGVGVEVKSSMYLQAQGLVRSGLKVTAPVAGVATTTTTTVVEATTAVAEATTTTTGAGSSEVSTGGDGMEMTEEGKAAAAGGLGLGVAWMAGLTGWKGAVVGFMGLVVGWGLVV